MKLIFKHGFNMSEVLISLGIIGVIASLVLPAIINNINDMHYKASYKKAYSGIVCGTEGRADRKRIRGDRYRRELP